MAITSSYPVAGADSVALTHTSVTSLASSASLGGAEVGFIDNRSTKDLNHIHHGKITGHATVALTANTQINFYAFLPISIGTGGTVITWPDVLDGTDSTETLTNQSVKNGMMKLVHTIDVVDTTAAIGYGYSFDIASHFGGMPPVYGLFIQQNTGQALNATGGNHVMHYDRVQAE
jgi:hypothetical protein